MRTVFKLQWVASLVELPDPLPVWTPKDQIDLISLSAKLIKEKVSAVRLIPRTKLDVWLETP